MRNDGISFASLTFVTKIMNALAVLVFGAFVVMAGYEAGVTVTPVMQDLVFVSITSPVEGYAYRPSRLKVIHPG